MSVLKTSQHLKIPLKEIEIATNDFQMSIGKGGYGMVYKGELSIDGELTIVAVKRLNEQFGQGLKEFLMEIQLLTGQNHPNLITLIGYCDEGKEKIIVYDYAENGSLDRYLRRSNTFRALTWLERLKICLHAARGLNHLHNHVGKHQYIIHRDIKSSNILIDHNWDAKISDLGLSKLSFAGLNRSAVISHACGTPGYCEPEYFSTGIVKKESDVYSFGMVLFEVLCGRLCFIRGDDDFLLSSVLVKKYYKEKKLDEIVDPILRDQTSSDLINQFAAIAYKCLHDDRGERPPMDLVVKDLEELLNVQLAFLWETPHKNSWSLEASELHKFDEALQARAKAVVYEIDLEVEDRAMSFDLEMEGNWVLPEMNQDVVKFVLMSRESIGGNQKLVKLVEDYFDASLQMLNFLAVLEKCLRKARGTRLFLQESVHHFYDENGVKENRYGKALDILKKFMAAGDPFTQEFFKLFNFVYEGHISFLEKLKKKRAKLNEELNREGVDVPLPENYKNDIEEQKEVFRLLQTESSAVFMDLRKIQTLVNRLHIDIEYHLMNVDFAIEKEDALKFVTENIKKLFSPFPKIVGDLEQMATLCATHVRRARAVVLHIIIKSPSNF